MPRFKSIRVEIHVNDIKKAMHKWSDSSTAKFNELHDIPDWIIERVSTSIYHQLQNKNSIIKKER